MGISSDLVRLDCIDPIFLPHLPLIASCEGVGYTSTEKIRLLFNDKAKVKMLKEEALNKRLMASQKQVDSEDEDDNHRLD